MSLLVDLRTAALKVRGPPRAELPSDACLASGLLSRCLKGSHIIAWGETPGLVSDLYPLGARLERRRTQTTSLAPFGLNSSLLSHGVQGRCPWL